jgi:hypothetical protein
VLGALLVAPAMPLFTNFVEKEEFSEVRGGRNLQEVMGARAPLRGKNSRTGRSRPASESTMNTIWWT